MSDNAPPIITIIEEIDLALRLLRYLESIRATPELIAFVRRQYKRLVKEARQQ